MDAHIPEDVTPLQKAVAEIQINAEKLGYNDNWKSFETDNGVCKFYFDPALADKLMDANKSDVVRQFIKAEINDNNSFVANGNIKDLSKSSPAIKEIYQQESISASGWDWTNDKENEQAFEQRSAITLGSKQNNYDSFDEFKDMFGGSKEKTPAISDLKNEEKTKISNDSLSEFNELFGGDHSTKTPTLAELKKNKIKPN